MSLKLWRKLSIANRRFARFIISHVSKWLLKEPYMPPTILSDYERLRFEVRPCDVLLIEGHNRVSRIIQQITQSNWSHACLYIGKLHDIEDPKLRILVKRVYKVALDEQLIIESILGEGTIISSLSRYKKYHVRICRPEGLLARDAQKVISYALSHLGMNYSTRHIFDLFRFLFPYTILPRRWRSTLFEHNALKPTEEICTLMIANAFRKVDYPILPYMHTDREGVSLVIRNPKLYTPRDFDYSPYFAIVKYPLMTLGGSGFYHNLPWKQGLLSDDGKQFYPETKTTEVPGPLLNKQQQSAEKADAGADSTSKHQDGKSGS